MSTLGPSAGTSTPPQHSHGYLNGLPTPHSIEACRPMMPSTAGNGDGREGVNETLDGKDLVEHNVTYGLGLRTDGSSHLSDLTNVDMAQRTHPGPPMTTQITPLDANAYSQTHVDLHHSSAFGAFPGPDAAHHQHVPHPELFQSPAADDGNRYTSRQLFTPGHASHHSGEFSHPNMQLAHQGSMLRPVEGTPNMMGSDLQTPPSSAQRPSSRPNLGLGINAAASGPFHPMSAELHHIGQPLNNNHGAPELRNGTLPFHHGPMAMNEISPTADRRPIKSHPTSPILRHRVPTTDQVLGVASTTSRLHGGRTILTHRPSHSLGQVGAIMSTAHERLQFDQSHASAPASPTDGMTPASLANLLQLSGQRPPMVTQGGEFSTFFENPFGHAHHQHFVRMSNHSARSTSPSVSMASTSITSISPLGNGRLNADSSFTSQEASFDSLSNAASGSISRASSTSEELYFHELGSMGLPASLRINKQKKKLRNIDRKLICEFSEASPNAKQDTIASHFGIERSTVSKILKQKDKWLAIDPDSDLARIAKHRAVKFPAVEDRLANWVARLKSEGTPIKDAMIRQEALNVARELGLGEDKFKASGGWIEKFRERNAIPKPQIKEEAADRGTAEPSPSSQTQPSQATMKQGASTQADQGPAQENPDAETNRELLCSPSSLATDDSTTSPGRKKMRQTPQKRSRSDLDDQPQTASLSPLNAELDRMQFQAMDAEAVRSMMGHSSHLMDFGQAPQMATMSAQIVSGADAPPGPGISEGMQSPSVPDFEMHEEAACHKRRRAVQRCTPSLSSSSSSSSSQSHVADALGLGPAFNFQFPAPTHILPRPDSVSSSAKLASNAADDELSELKPSDANIGSRGEGDVDANVNGSGVVRSGGDSRSNGRGKPRRGPARLARKHHQPQTPSPLRMSPPELPLGSSDSMQPDATSMGQLALATMESLREGLSSTSGSSIVSAEQAQQSLELVLRFLNEQPSNFLPANHFMVFGHLQANIEQLIRERSRPGSSSGDSRSLQTPASTSQSPDGETDDAAAAGQT